MKDIINAVTVINRLIERKYKITIDDVNYSLFGDVTGQETKITKILHVMSVCERCGLDSNSETYKRLADNLSKLK